MKFLKHYRRSCSLISVYEACDLAYVPFCCVSLIYLNWFRCLTIKICLRAGNVLLFPFLFVVHEVVTRSLCIPYIPLWILIFAHFGFFLFILCSLHGWNGKPKITTEQKNKLNQICTRVTHSFPYIKFINLFWHRCFRSNKFNMKLCDVMHLHSAYSSDWHISKLSSRTHVMQHKKKDRTSHTFQLLVYSRSLERKKCTFLFQYVDVVRSIRLQPKFNE